MKVYYDKDADISLIRNKKVTIVGYGSQGHAHAQNLHDSGVNITVALRKNSPSWSKAKAAGLKVQDITAIENADVVMVLLPDQYIAGVYNQNIAKNMKSGATLGFAHGFCVHYNQIKPRQDIDVIMVAPKGPGHSVRSEYVNGRGVPSLIAVYQDRSGQAHDIALSYAAANGGTKGGVIKTTFSEETEIDLFGEQTVLCGGLVELVKMGFETLTEAGYAPEMAYLECLHELKLIVDLMYQGGISNMNHSISNNAEYGGYITGRRVIGEESRQAMRDSLKNIQNGEYAKKFILESQANYPEITRTRRLNAAHPIETIGAQLRRMMPWIDKKKLLREIEV